MYLNDKPFPDNETGKEPFVKCSDDASSAEAYCPKRYKAMQAWRDKEFKRGEQHWKAVEFPSDEQSPG